MKQLEDLEFADDISLLSRKQQDAQEKLRRAAEEARKTGLQINTGKTEAMCINNKQADPLRLHQENIKEVEQFVYLGSVVNKDGGTEEDIRCRINKARYAFNTLRKIWRSTALSVQNKIRIFNSNVKSVLLYGSETWRITKTSTQKLQTFTNRCLRNILNIRWPEVISNEELWNKAKQTHRDGDQKAQMGLDRPHTTKACIQHHKASPGVESSGKAQGWSPEADLATKHR